MVNTFFHIVSLTYPNLTESGTSRPRAVCVCVLVVLTEYATILFAYYAESEMSV